MTTVTGLTAERMIAIEGASVVNGQVDGAGNLILTKHDGNTINAGHVAGAQGPQGTPGAPGAQGPPGVSSTIPGEVKLWPSSVLPALGTYGKWVWADGNHYLKAESPQAAANIDAAWRTFGGAADPGQLRFRVPDLRGLAPVGMDAMPGGARANRMTRAVAITIAGRTGEETHVVSIAEMPTHFHGGGYHTHSVSDSPHENYELPSDGMGGGKTNVPFNRNPSTVIQINQSGQVIQHEGGGQPHENVQPTVFVPYIVALTG